MKAWQIALTAAVTSVAVSGCSGGGDGGPGFFRTPSPESNATGATPVATPHPATPAELAHAWETYRLGDYEQAEQEFSGVAAASEAGSNQRSEALLGAAVAGDEAGHADASAASLHAARREAPAGSDIGRQAAYLLGLRLNETGDHRGAREALEPFAAESPGDPLRPFILNEYATALAGTGDDDAAAAAWDALLAEGAPQRLIEDVYRARAAAADDAGDHETELRWLDAYIATTADPGAQLTRASVLGELGDNAGRITALRTIVSRHPSSLPALAALELLQAAAEAVDPGEAGLVYYRRQQYEAAIAVLEPAAADPSATTEERAFRRYYLAASWEGLGQYETAIGLYEQAAATGANSPYVHRAKWWAARLTEETGDSSNAAGMYLDLAANGPAGEFTADAAFRAGYALSRGGDPAGAIAVWDELGKTSDARVLYWRGRARAAAGDAPGSRAEFEAAVTTDPDSFHGLVAAEELAGADDPDAEYEPLVAIPAIDWGALEAWLVGFVPGTAVQPPDTAAARALVTVGEREAAGALILESAGGSDPWSLLARARQAHELGLTAAALQLATKLRRATEGGPVPPIDLLRLEYPLTYVTLLDAAGRAYGVDPLFLAAIIRQESLWEPGAGSSAGALGLMQVVPPTGIEIAEALEVDDFETNDLFRPSVAIPFGAFYIDRQLDAFGEAHAALAAYNGGPGNAARWLESSPGERAADFVETVDYAETQSYVVLVLEHYARYREAWR